MSCAAIVARQPHPRITCVNRGEHSISVAVRAADVQDQCIDIDVALAQVVGHELGFRSELSVKGRRGDARFFCHLEMRLGHWYRARRTSTRRPENHLARGGAGWGLHLGNHTGQYSRVNRSVYNAWSKCHSGRLTGQKKIFLQRGSRQPADCSGLSP